MRAFYQMQKKHQVAIVPVQQSWRIQRQASLVASDEFFGTHVCHLWNFNDRAAFVVSTTKIPELFTLNSS